MAYTYAFRLKDVMSCKPSWGGEDDTTYGDIRCEFNTTDNTASITISGNLYARAKGDHNGSASFTRAKVVATVASDSSTYSSSELSVSVSPDAFESGWIDSTKRSFTITVPKKHSNTRVDVSLTGTFSVHHNGADPNTINLANGTFSGSKSFGLSIRPSYTVSYAPNGGSSTPAAQTKWHDEALTPAAAISRTGYSFYRWKATNGTLYVAGSSGAYTANSGTTMTAQWNANTYTVVYNGNGNTGGSTASSSHTYDVQKALTANGFTKTDYLFKGWATTQDGPVVYSNGQSVANLTATHGGTVNLYAVWEKAYVEPNILNLSVERVRPTTVNNDTVYVLDDEGKIGKVFITANPGKKKSVPGDQNPQPIPTRLQIYYKRSVSDASEQNLLELITYDTINTDGASSTQYIDATSTGKTGFEIGTDEQCEILVIAQGIDDNAVKCTALRSTVLMVAKYIVDFNQNPQYDSVGFFGVAPDINDVVYVKGDILIEVDPNSGTDELYNAIHALGWDNDVLIN